MVNIRAPWAFQDLVQELDRMTRSADWAFGDSSVRSSSKTNGLSVKDDAATLELELPGVRQEDLSIELEDRKLTLSASRADLHQEGEDVVLRERSYGEFSQKFSLPWPVEENEIEARFVDGVLSVRLPRAPESEPRRITIQSS